MFFSPTFLIVTIELTHGGTPIPCHTVMTPDTADS